MPDIEIKDPKREAKNLRRFVRWIESIEYADGFTFEHLYDNWLLIVQTTPSARVKTDTVTVRIRLELEMSMPSTWRWALLEMLLLLERHQVYEKLKIGGKRVYEPHDAALNFRDDPRVSIEAVPE